VQVLEVDDVADPRLADYARLRDVQLRTKVAKPHGVFIAEGPLVVARALEAGMPLRSVVCYPEHVDEVLAVVAGHDVPVYVAPQEFVGRLTGYPEHRGALASFARVPPPRPEQVLRDARLVVVLEDTLNPTNLGVILRSAAGLGMDAVVLSPRCTDPLYRRSVRASMGEVFRVPWTWLPEWPAGLATLTDAGFSLAALTPGPDAVPIDEADLSAPRLGLLLGTEGPGLSAAALGVAGVRVSIPMAHGVDSLNVGVAAGIAMWEVARRRH
jgi:tRNA G18 (ribose-2'-O)-methylase SpoU